MARPLVYFAAALVFRTCSQEGTPSWAETVTMSVAYKELVVLRYLLGDPNKGREHDLVITFSQLEPPYSSVLQDHALKGVDELLPVSAARFLIRLRDKLSGHVAVE